MISFKSRLAVITGAGSGIGRALALALAKEGASLALADINPETLAAVAEEAKAAGAPQIYQQTFDVVDESAWGAFAERVKTEIGMADLVFNNAGIARMGRFEHTSSEAFASVMDVNFWGVVYGTRAFLSQVKLRQGSFVNISSVFGLIGVPGNSHYCASKFGVRGFSESIRQEFAQFGVHVASVHPGGINTNIAKSAEFDEGAESREQMLKRVHEKGLVMPPAKAADIILAGVRKRKPRILVGNDAKLLSFI
ncbi:MAG: SDR family oxidoreductase, partial [Cellvibrionaceae bacterium]|nr:SDR family oxidoreductase [Cellvibrionaceae bacterium]